MNALELVRTLRALRDDPLAAFSALRERHGSVVRIPLGARTFYVVGGAGAARRVLCDNARNYSKDTWSYGLLRRVLGAGLLTSETADWRRQRRLLQPTFHRSKLPGLADTTLARTDALLERWRTLGAGAELDVGREMSTLSLEILAHAVLGIELGRDRDAVLAHLSACLAYIRDRTSRLFDVPEWWPLSHHARFRAELAALDAIVRRIILARRAAPAAGDLVSTLLAARDEAGHPLGDREVLAQIKTFLLAGHETTANLLTWMLALLARHPEAARRIEIEVQAVAGSSRLSAEVVSGLPYTRAVVAEALRLYPPLWLVERRALAADILDGHAIEPGATVAVSQYLLQRDSAVFAEPERFMPERFLRGERPQGYLPFGAGSRTCIGDAFALLQASTIVARLAQRGSRLTLTAPELPRPEALVTLRPSAPVTVRLAG